MSYRGITNLYIPCKISADIVDAKKAFDTVNRDCLLFKLKTNIGIR